MRPRAFDLHRAFAVVSSCGGTLRSSLRWASHHTGLPVVLVAAIALVTSWRLLRRTARFVVEVVVAVALLLVAARFGWIRW